MDNFEERLRNLEDLSEKIKVPDVSLEDALRYFEDGIKLAKGMEKELDAIEGKIQTLMNAGDAADPKDDDGPAGETSAGADADGDEKKTRSRGAKKEKPKPEMSLFGGV
ncbi:MAG: exodeoxyribonuclease VII small subunit [Spirochaetaceae bacterium]|jgi:exodeoxyribonuclease VII small subunit|nr:exodeoxyribonuclease VII small subunit [Spirochaetaceae bacterium]